MPLPWQKFRWNTCLPWPLVYLCRRDNALGPHDDSVSWICGAHDRAINLCARLNLLKLSTTEPVPEFYEDDQPVEQVKAAFEHGEKFVTRRPDEDSARD